jgi:hypothetical protein
LLLGLGQAAVATVAHHRSFVADGGAVSLVCVGVCVRFGCVSACSTDCTTLVAAPADWAAQLGAFAGYLQSGRCAPNGVERCPTARLLLLLVWPLLLCCWPPRGLYRVRAQCQRHGASRCRRQGKAHLPAHVQSLLVFRTRVCVSCWLFCGVCGWRQVERSMQVRAMGTGPATHFTDHHWGY